MSDTELLYRQAQRAAQAGQGAEAQTVYEQLLEQVSGGRLRALVLSDLGTLAALRGELPMATGYFQSALETDADCRSARINLQAIGEPETVAPTSKSDGENGEVRTRIAVLSLLFNWPSTGGGIIHTVELVRFLRKAGYDVRHLYAVFPGWDMGRVTEELPGDHRPLVFDDASWNADGIRQRFREALDEYRPDWVVITDSWNSKPLLAEAARGYRYVLRLAAQELLCPLNNVRLLMDGSGRFCACPRHQLATPDVCRACVQTQERCSGGLHRAERALVGFGGADYDKSLRRAVAEAEAVLVVNPLIAEMVKPYAKRVEVVTSGFDVVRFPWPWPEENQQRRPSIFFAGLVDELMKGFTVLQAACERLWSMGWDFELVATGEPTNQHDARTRFIGWLSQEDLPSAMRRSDIIVCPTLAEEALGRTAVEAMGVGRPVVASRIGGLQFTVIDGLTGFLCPPGDDVALAETLARLLGDTELRERLGREGRKRFEEHYTWDVIIPRHYEPLFGPSKVGRALSSVIRSERKSAVPAEPM